MRAPEFWLLVCVTAGGALGGRWWLFVGLGIVGLSMSASPKYLGMRKQAIAADVEWQWLVTIVLSMFNSFAAVWAAFVLGALTRFLWG